MFNIYYSVSLNNKYFNVFLISFLSLIANTQEPLKIFLLVDDWKKENTEIEKKLQGLLTKQNNESKLIIIDCKELIKKHLNYPKWEFKSNYNPTLIMIRWLILYIPEIMNLDKLLYLDCDTYINGDIKQLYNIDLTNKSIAGVNEFFIWERKNIRPELRKHSFNHYLNSAVLLMNIKNMKDYISKIIDLSFEKFNDIQMLDMTTMNLIIPQEQKLTLPKKFNYFATCRSKSLNYYLWAIKNYLTVQLRKKLNITYFFKKKFKKSFNFSL